MGYETQEKVLLPLKQIHSIGMCFVSFILMPNCFAKEMMNWAFSLWLLTRYKKNRRCKWERVIASVYISSVLENRLQSFQKKSIAWLQIILERKQQKAQRSCYKQRLIGQRKNVNDRVGCLSSWKRYLVFGSTRYIAWSQ